MPENESLPNDDGVTHRLKADTPSGVHIHRRGFLRRASLSAAALSAPRFATAAVSARAALPDTNAIMAHVEALYNCGVRRPAGPADAKGEKYILSMFQRFGLHHCRMEPYPHKYWAPKEPSLSLLEGDRSTPIPCFYVPTSKFTPAHGLDAEMVYVGTGQNLEHTDIAGKIVVFDQLFGSFPPDALKRISLFSHKLGQPSPVDAGHQPWNRLNFSRVAKAAEARKAVGLVGLLSQMPYDTDRYYAPYDGYYWPFTGLWIRPSRCDVVRAHASAGGKAKIVLTGTDEPAETRNIIGVLPGKTDEVITIASHHDGPFRSAVEDATGMAEVLALAEAFGALGPGVLNKTLLFLSCASHFGELGSYHFVKKHYADLLPRVALHLHIEHVGIECQGVQGRLVPTGRRQLRVVFTSAQEPKIASLLKQAIIAENLDRIMILPASNPLTGPVFPADGSPMHAAGVPTMNYISGPIYLLNEDDTLDKVDTGQLVPVARTFLRVLQSLDPVRLVDIKRPPALLGPDFTIAKNPLSAIREKFMAERLRKPPPSNEHP